MHFSSPRACIDFRSPQTSFLPSTAAVAAPNLKPLPTLHNDIISTIADRLVESLGSLDESQPKFIDFMSGDAVRQVTDVRKVDVALCRVSRSAFPSVATFCTRASLIFSRTSDCFIRLNHQIKQLRRSPNLAALVRSISLSRRLATRETALF